MCIHPTTIFISSLNHVRSRWLSNPTQYPNSHETQWQAKLSPQRFFKPYLLMYLMLFEFSHNEFWPWTPETWLLVNEEQFMSRPYHNRGQHRAAPRLLPAADNAFRCRRSSSSRPRKRTWSWDGASDQMMHSQRTVNGDNTYCNVGRQNSMCYGCCSWGP